MCYRNPPVLGEPGAEHVASYMDAYTAFNLSNIFGSRKPFRENAAVVKRRSHIPVAFDVFPPRPA